MSDLVEDKPRWSRVRWTRVPTALATIAAVAAAAEAHGAGSGTSGPGSVTVAAAQGKTITLGDDSGRKPTTTSPTTVVPPAHTVKKGDTLWDICDGYFGNPWQWPRVWSYNPEILNPHWIYPGDVIRLRKGGEGASAAITPAAGASRPLSAPLRPRAVGAGTVFLRNQGFVYDANAETSGEVTGSPEDKMLLSALDRIYVRLTPEQAKAAGPGDDLTIFEPTRTVKRSDGTTVGSVVAILGTVRLDLVDRDKGLATGTITESLDVIERGARVGPVERRIDVVPPKTNGAELRGTLLASVRPNEMFGQNQVVFVDKGEKDGLQPGNRLFVVHKGDPWQEGLSSTGAYAASKVGLGGDGPPTVEATSAEQSKDYPEEVLAEIRVIRVRKETATCLVTMSRRELVAGDPWIAKKGY